MIPEIGHFLLCLALGISCLLGLYPAWGPCATTGG